MLGSHSDLLRAFCPPEAFEPFRIETSAHNNSINSLLYLHLVNNENKLSGPRCPDNGNDAVAWEQYALPMGCKCFMSLVVRGKVAHPGSKPELEPELSAVNHNSCYKFHEVSE